MKAKFKPLNAQPLNRKAKSMAQSNPVASLSSVAGNTRSANKFTPGTGLEANGVHAWFGKHHALADINLEFPANTVTALIGPSGCGKSTFLRTLNRMHEFIPGAAMAGEVLLDGKDIYEP